jgi:hypothetical protein
MPLKDWSLLAAGGCGDWSPGDLPVDRRWTFYAFVPQELDAAEYRPAEYGSAEDGSEYGSAAAGSADGGNGADGGVPGSSGRAVMVALFACESLS